MSIYDDLIQAKELLEKGVITEEEFNTIKNKFLGSYGSNQSIGSGQNITGNSTSQDDKTKNTGSVEVTTKAEQKLPKKADKKKLFVIIGAILVLLLIIGIGVGSDEDYDSADDYDDSYEYEDNSSVHDSSATTGEQEALECAWSYLENVGGFSEESLRDQLDYEGYLSNEIDYAIAYCGADWEEQCRQCALDYLDTMDFSRQSLIEQLEYEGFSYDMASKIVDEVY